MSERSTDEHAHAATRLARQYNEQPAARCAAGCSQYNRDMSDAAEW